MHPAATLHIVHTDAVARCHRLTSAGLQLVFGNGMGGDYSALAVTDYMQYTPLSSHTTRVAGSLLGTAAADDRFHTPCLR